MLSDKSITLELAAPTCPPKNPVWTYERDEQPYRTGVSLGEQGVVEAGAMTIIPRVPGCTWMENRKRFTWL